MGPVLHNPKSVVENGGFLLNYASRDDSLDDSQDKLNPQNIDQKQGGGQLDLFTRFDYEYHAKFVICNDSRGGFVGLFTMSLHHDIVVILFCRKK
jgi:hypothetical protein